MCFPQKLVSILFLCSNFARRLVARLAKTFQSELEIIAHSNKSPLNQKAINLTKQKTKLMPIRPAQVLLFFKSLPAMLQKNY